MARYIKANPKVVQYLHLENDRNQVSDGNYLLWQADMLAFGTLVDLPLILQQIGGISLMAHEARQEQDGIVVRELPTATDERFIVEKDETEAEQPETIEPGNTEDEAAEPEQTESTDPEQTENGETVETTNEETEA